MAQGDGQRTRCQNHAAHAIRTRLQDAPGATSPPRSRAIGHNKDPPSRDVARRLTLATRTVQDMGPTIFRSNAIPNPPTTASTTASIAGAGSTSSARQIMGYSVRPQGTIPSQ